MKKKRVLGMEGGNLEGKGGEIGKIMIILCALRYIQKIISGFLQKLAHCSFFEGVLILWVRISGLFIGCSHFSLTTKEKTKKKTPFAKS